MWGDISSEGKSSLAVRVDGSIPPWISVLAWGMSVFFYGCHFAFDFKDPIVDTNNNKIHTLPGQKKLSFQFKSANCSVIILGSVSWSGLGTASQQSS